MVVEPTSLSALLDVIYPFYKLSDSFFSFFSLVHANCVLIFAVIRKLSCSSSHSIIVALFFFCFLLKRSFSCWFFFVCVCFVHFIIFGGIYAVFFLFFSFFIFSRHCCNNEKQKHRFDRLNVPCVPLFSLIPL